MSTQPDDKSGSTNDPKAPKPIDPPPPKDTGGDEQPPPPPTDEP